MMIAILVALLIASLATGLIWVCSSRLEVLSEQLSIHYDLPDVVRGGVITAVASSFPELSSVVISTVWHGEFELGVATIIGSAIFNILVIPGVCTLASRKLEADRDIVYKEMLFYLLAIAVFSLTLACGVVFQPSDAAPHSGHVSRSLALLPLFTYLFYLYIQWQDSRESSQEKPKTDPINIKRAWGLLAICLFFLALGVELLVRTAIQLGEIFDTPSFLWGLTIIAAGSSLPDLFISLKTSREGEDTTSLANVLGSNTFDLLVAVPIGVLIAGASLFNFGRSIPLLGCLAGSTLLVFVLMRNQMNLRIRDALIMLGTYGLFVGWLILESIGMVNLLR